MRLSVRTGELQYLPTGLVFSEGMAGREDQRGSEKGRQARSCGLTLTCKEATVRLQGDKEEAGRDQTDTTRESDALWSQYVIFVPAFSYTSRSSSMACVCGQGSLKRNLRIS